MEKKIEEMANDIAQMCPNLAEDCCGDINCATCLAKGLMKLGYRKQEWISVEERLPIETGSYLVTDVTEYTPSVWKQKFKADGRWFPTFKEPCFVDYSDDVYFKTRVKITHWMPLPQPPQMKGE